MGSSDDILCDLLQRCMAAGDRLLERLPEIEREMRHTWGGERVLIAKIAPWEREERAQRVQAAVLAVGQGTSAAEAAERLGLSRRTIYRALRRRGLTGR